MAPVTTVPHKSNNHQRYLPEKQKNASASRPEFDLDESDAEAGALQPVSDPRDTEWKGLDVAEDAQDSDNEEESDDGGEDIAMEDKIPQKVIQPKDAEEEELERMIFGDSAGFQQGLEDFSLGRTAGAYGDVSEEDNDEEEEDLEAVDDQDLFFFDAGPVAAPGTAAPAISDETEDDDDKPAWDDSDDERLVLSLASVPQLKKLRETVDDDMVNGKEYSRRLRKQYERLYPAPDWALHAMRRANKKRRHTIDEDESGEGSASDMDMDEDDLSSQPLARLLKDADILSRTTIVPSKRRKLQAGTVDIQRLKDVMKAGPVSSISTWMQTILTSALVCNNIIVVPPVLPITSLIRPKLNTTPAPRQPKPADTEPSPYLPPHQAHASCYNRLSSVSNRLSHLPQRQAPLLPCLEHCNRQGGEGVACIRPPA